MAVADRYVGPTVAHRPESRILAAFDVGGEDGLYVVAVVEALFRSIGEERAVAVEPIG